MWELQDAVVTVKAFLPEKKLNPMIDQLQRFLEFMKLTVSDGAIFYASFYTSVVIPVGNLQNEKNAGGNRSVEKIIDLLERLN